jgi:uncharacterized lipoprotein YehR (DUF1307 family)
MHDKTMYFLFSGKKVHIMKRAISLLVALVLCVSLCACGGVDERYTALIACLDSHDYEGAVDQVMMLRE